MPMAFRASRDKKISKAKPGTVEKESNITNWQYLLIDIDLLFLAWIPSSNKYIIIANPNSKLELVERGDFPSGDFHRTSGCGGRSLSGNSCGRCLSGSCGLLCGSGRLSSCCDLFEEKMWMLSYNNETEWLDFQWICFLILLLHCASNFLKKCIAY